MTPGQRTTIWWLAAIAAAAVGIAGALLWFRPDHVTLTPPEEAAPSVPPQTAPPARAALDRPRA